MPTKKGIKKMIWENIASTEWDFPPVGSKYKSPFMLFLNLNI